MPEIMDIDNGPVAGGAPQAVPPGGKGGAQPNVMSQSAGAYGAALRGTMNAGGAPVPTLAGTNLSAYQNPFQSDVIDATLSGLDRSNRMALQNVNAGATGAGAFGGSRHGIAQAETNRNFADVASQTLAGLNRDNFDNAQRGAMFDIGNQMAGRQLGLQAAGQMGNLANLGFGFGTQINNDLSRNGAIQQGLTQSLINAARQQYGGFTGAPQNALSLPLAALGASPMPQSSTTTQEPGLLNFLSLGLGLL